VGTFAPFCLLFAVVCAASASAQGDTSGPGPTQSVDPAFTARLFLASENVTPSNPTQVLLHETAESRHERLTLRRGRWLLGTGLGIAAGSVLGAALFARSTYCDNQERKLNMKAPRVTSAVVALVGATMALMGNVRLAGIPEKTRGRHAFRVGQRVGIIAASVGLSVLSSAMVGIVALPETVDCWST